MDNSSFFSTPIAGLLLKIAWAFNLIAIAIVFIDASIYESSLRVTSYWPWLIISELIIVFLLWKHYKAFNKQLDRMVSNALSGSNIKPILLYLRPFVSDGYLIIRSAKGILPIIDTADVFEGKLLSVVCEKYIPIRFDESENNESKKLIYKIWAMFSYRCGRHFDDTDGWLNTVDRMLDKCELCIIVPPAAPDSSTSEEIKMALERSIMEKLVFIMPDKDSSFKTNEGVKIPAKQLWGNLLQITKDIIQLPDYSRNGGFVLSVNGRMTLIEACHGFDWFYKKAMKKIFMTGELTCSNWLGSLKITNKLAWQFLPLSVLYTIISLAFIYFNLSVTKIGEFSAFAIFLTFLLLHTQAFYRYCSKFFLTKNQATGLVISTLVALLIGWMTASYVIIKWEILLIDILELNLIEKPDFGSTDLYPTYTLSGLFLLWSVISAFVYVTAFLFFCGQRKLVFKAAS